MVVVLAERLNNFISSPNKLFNEFSENEIMITGNAALSLGAVSAGLDSYYGYPISPATTILIWMEQNLISEGKFVFQVASEIEAINNIVKEIVGVER